MELATYYLDCRGHERDKRAGEDMYQAIHVLGNGFSAIEQRAAFFTYPVAEDAWSGVLLSDTGRRLESPPWRAGRGVPKAAEFASFNMADIDHCLFMRSTDLEEARVIMRSSDPFAWRVRHRYCAMGSQKLPTLPGKRAAAPHPYLKAAEAPFAEGEGLLCGGWPLFWLGDAIQAEDIERAGVIFHQLRKD